MTPQQLQQKQRFTWMTRQVLEWLLRILLVLSIGAKLESLILETETNNKF